MAPPARATSSPQAQGAQPAIANGADAADLAGAPPATGPEPRSDGAGRRADRAGLSDRALLAITAALTLPMVWLGYGTDLDVADVRYAGSLIRAGDYHPSRNPGVPVFETVVGLLDPIGGHVAINLACSAAAAASVVGLARLVRQWGRPNGDVIALAFLAAPITLIAATSSTDFIWAIAFFVWAAVAHLRNHSVLAGLLFALAVGSRSSTVVMIAAFLVADGWDRDHRRRCLATAAVLIPAGVALYVPAWLAYDRTFGFLSHSDSWRGLGNNLGRFAYKNYAVAGVPLVVVTALAVPALVRALGRWSSDPMVRFGVMGFVVTEALFLQLPWKPAHLLPCLLTFLVWVAASDRNRRPFLAVLVAAIAINGLVAFRPLAPDDPDASESARFDPAITIGLLVNDIDCRADFMHVEPSLNSGSWACHLEPMRGSSADDPTPPGT